MFYEGGGSVKSGFVFFFLRVGEALIFNFFKEKRLFLMELKLCSGMYIYIYKQRELHKKKQDKQTKR